MDENRESGRSVGENELRQDRLIAGRESLVRGLKPFGCALVLLCFVVLLVFLFTGGPKAIEGYEAPHDSEYYALHIAELAAEIEENVLPKLEGVSELRVADDGTTVLVAIGSDCFVETRAVLLKHFDRGLFTFVKAED